MSGLLLFLALFWGILWALFLQHNPEGHYLALRRTWITVVIGVGVDLLILALGLPLAEWLLVVAVMATSSLGIIARSLYNERLDERAVQELHHVRRRE